MTLDLSTDQLFTIQMKTKKKLYFQVKKNIKKNLIKKIMD